MTVALLNQVESTTITVNCSDLLFIVSLYFLIVRGEPTKTTREGVGAEENDENRGEQN